MARGGIKPLYINLEHLKPGEWTKINTTVEVVKIYIHAREIHFDSYVYDIDDNVFFPQAIWQLKKFPTCMFFSEIMTSWSKVAADLEFVVTGGRVKFLSAL